MPVFSRKDSHKLLTQIDQGQVSPVYLICGERYLCREMSQKVVARLLPDEKQRVQNLKIIDGDQEDQENTLLLLRTYSLFPGRRVINVIDTRLFHSKNVSRSIWEKAKQAFSSKDFNQAGRYIHQFASIAEIEADEISDFPANRWKSIFNFAKPKENLGWIKEILNSSDSSAAPKGKQGNDITDIFVETLEKGIPPSNILVLVADTIDKRKKFYKYLKDHCAVIDLSVDTGFSAAARKEQDAILQDLVTQTLAGYNKQIDPKILPAFLERVGFHPVAIVREAEKLALFADDTSRITKTHLDALVGRTREEALYEFTEAFATQNLSTATLLLARMRENGIHPLAVLAGLRNHIRKLLFIRAVQCSSLPAYSHQTFPSFQKNYLPGLKEKYSPLPEFLTGHPFVLYKTFSQARNFSRNSLKKCLSDLLDAEFKIKSSSLPDFIIVENFLFNFLVSRRSASQSR